MPQYGNRGGLRGQRVTRHKNCIICASEATYIGAIGGSWECALGTRAELMQGLLTGHLNPLLITGGDPGGAAWDIGSPIPRNFTVSFSAESQWSGGCVGYTDPFLSGTGKGFINDEPW